MSEIKRHKCDCCETHKIKTMMDLVNLHKTNFGGTVWICDLCAKRLSKEGEKIREECQHNFEAIKEE